MKNISISLPVIYLQNIQKLIDLQLVANRSEAIRTAVREFLCEEYTTIKLLGLDTEK